jgi:hypothetical protein
LVAPIVVFVATSVISAAVLGDVEARKTSSSDDIVWHWSNKCLDRKLVTAELVLDGTIVYTSDIPICHVRRSNIKPEARQTILKFTFQEKARSLFGETQGVRLEANLWEAGGETGTILLGVSAMSKDQVLLNAMHIASPDEATQTELAQGLIIKTYPALARH